MAKLPKSYIKQYGISKEAWRHYKADLAKKPYKKVNKGGRTRVTKRKKTMAKTIRRRYRRYRAKRKRRKKDKRISIIGTAGAVGSVFVPAEGRTSLGMWAVNHADGTRPIKPEDAPHILADTVAQYTGFDWRKEHPMLSIPWATVAIVATSIAAGIANKYGGKYLKNLPFVGKYVKF